MGYLVFGVFVEIFNIKEVSQLRIKFEMNYNVKDF